MFILLGSQDCPGTFDVALLRGFVTAAQQQQQLAAADREIQPVARSVVDLQFR
jgi:hypothetical protein